MTTQLSAMRPCYILAKPGGSACNLACSYCYYLEKGDGKRRMMDDSTLEEFIRQYIDAQPNDEVWFTWHGGEPMALPIQFYEKALAFQKKHAKGKRIDNCIQTNGTLINDKWCRFLKSNGWLAGVSIDGPEDLNDAHRTNLQGRGSFSRVMLGIRMLERYGVEWNAMATVNSLNAEYPEEFYNFFKSIGCRYLQFTPIVERIRPDGHLAHAATTGTVTPESVTPTQWGEFLCRVYDLWVCEDVGSVFVQLFDSTLARWVGETPGVCTLAPECGHAGAIEHDGDLYSCDHFVFDEYKLGNIREATIAGMMNSPRQREFGAMKRGSLPPECLRCRFSMICNGECPKNRFAISSTGKADLNYLCEGYRRFFSHVAADMDFMAARLRAGFPPADIMKLKKNT